MQAGKGAIVGVLTLALAPAAFALQTSDTYETRINIGTSCAVIVSNLGSVTSYSGTMTNGTDTIAYSAALSSAGGTGPGTVSILGLVPPQPTPSDGIYTDNRTVYLNY